MNGPTPPNRFPVAGGHPQYYGATPAASVAPMTVINNQNPSPTPPPMRMPAVQHNSIGNSIQNFNNNGPLPQPQARVPPIGTAVNAGAGSAFIKPVGTTTPQIQNQQPPMNNGYHAQYSQMGAMPQPGGPPGIAGPPSQMAGSYPQAQPSVSQPAMFPPNPSASNQQRFPPSINNTNSQNSAFPPMPSMSMASTPPGPPLRPALSTTTPNQPPGFPPMPNNAINPPQQQFNRPGVPPMPNFGAPRPPMNTGAMTNGVSTSQGYNGTNAGMPPMPPTMNMQQQPGMQNHQSASGVYNNNQMPLHTQQVPVDPNRPLDLMQERDIIHAGNDSLDAPSYTLPGVVENPRCRVEPLLVTAFGCQKQNPVFRSTICAVPQNKELLTKSRLPFGLILHPFRDLKSLNVINTSVIVRCRSCRTYINPFVTITDPRHWKCNMCFRTNDLPDEFNWDPVTKAYGEPQRRPEIKFATVEFIAPGEYMPVRKNAQNQNELRPAQAALYCFILDVSSAAIDSGYLYTLSSTLHQYIDKLPGDDRTQIAFMCVDACIRFYQFTDPGCMPTELVVSDIDEMFLPANSGLVVNLKTYLTAVSDFVENLPTMFENATSGHNALGAAVQIAHNLIQHNGGRITVMQCSLPDIGPGALQSREDPNMRAANGWQKKDKNGQVIVEVTNLKGATDFYKLLALECNGHQVAIDLFMMNSKYADLATLSEMSRFSGGVIHHFPSLHLLRNGLEMKRFENVFKRYLSRKIGFEAVLRIRCTRGLTLKQFYGNFFVRSTDLLALPNVNPDSVMGVQVDYDESLADNVQAVSFQAALLYTSSKGDRRIRVHTLCLPVTSKLPQLHDKLDVQAMMSLLAKLAVDRSIKSNVQDARDALINSCVDALTSYAHSLPVSMGPNSVVAPQSSLRLLPWYTLAMLRSSALVGGQSIKLDTRVGVMFEMCTAPTELLSLMMCPALYALHQLDPQESSSGTPARLNLSYERIDRCGVYLMDTGVFMYVYVGQDIPPSLCHALFNVNAFVHIDEDLPSLPEVANSSINQRVHQLIHDLNSDRCFSAPLTIIREDSPKREMFVRRLIEDRNESSHSYVEFLKYVCQQIPHKNR